MSSSEDDRSEDHRNLDQDYRLDGFQMRDYDEHYDECSDNFFNEH